MKRVAFLALVGIVLSSALMPCAFVQSAPPHPAYTFAAPLPRAQDRITKKPFGIFVSPRHSPIAPERFHGYHTGVDFETFPGEQTTAMPITAICSGTLILKAWVRGYGGVAVEKCALARRDLTVVYGHLNIKSIKARIGQHIAERGKIGILGKGFTTETDGERKHLHLGIHKGAAIDLRGYVSRQSELQNWIDGSLYIH